MDELDEILKALENEYNGREEDDFSRIIARRGIDRITKLRDQGRYEEALEEAEITLEDIENYEGYHVGAYAASDGEVDDESMLTPESLEEMAILAYHFDQSGDPLLRKQASVMDEILLTIGASKKKVNEAKNAQNAEIAKLKAEAIEQFRNEQSDHYTKAKKEHDKQNKKEEALKAISDRVKDYRPMEASLQTRTCPDHPGSQMARVSENVFQCSLDKNMYNYQGGYTMMNGSKVPGGDVSNQTLSFDRPNEFSSFDTRESRLNQ